ncbi:hypothetical protein PR048_012398 [Dryococelus australis]|uniref:Uncharacterized protein n=1 Tax=Dryococelus australis TaxID=614101 RepID=A0ABQ9HPA0_9NEOP|nr:hypothetical protein PR048_012398 [Dryococelus australis]
MVQQFSVSILDPISDLVSNHDGATGHKGRRGVVATERICSQYDTDNVIPSWTAFNPCVSEDRKQKTTISYFPIIPNPAHEHDTLWTIIARCNMISHLLKQDYSVITFDEYLYSKVKILMWFRLGETQNVTLLLGDFHSIQVYLTAIGEKHAGSVIEDCWVESGIVSETTASAIIKGKHFIQCVRTHKIEFEALWRALMSSFRVWLSNKSQDVDLDTIDVLSSDICEDFKNKNFNKISTDAQIMSGYLQDVRVHLSAFTEENSSNNIFGFWLQYLELIAILLNFIHASREGGWKEYVTDFKEMSKLMAFHDHRFGLDAREHLQSSIKKFNMKTFKDITSRLSVKGKSSKTSDTMIQQRLIAAVSSCRPVDISEILKHELVNIPQFIGRPDGSLNPAHKAPLSHVLMEVNCIDIIPSNPGKSALIVDGITVGSLAPIADKLSHYCETTNGIGRRSSAPNASRPIANTTQQQYCAKRGRKGAWKSPAANLCLTNLVSGANCRTRVVTSRDASLVHKTRRHSSGAHLHMELCPASEVEKPGRDKDYTGTRIKYKNAIFKTMALLHTLTRVAPGFSHVGIVQDDANGRRVFSGISRFLPPFHSGVAPYSPQSPTSVLKTSLLRLWTESYLDQADDAQQNSRGALEHTASLLGHGRSRSCACVCKQLPATRPPGFYERQVALVTSPPCPPETNRL